MVSGVLLCVEMTQKIPLTKGYAALVDDDKYEWLMQWKWHAVVRPVNVNAARRVGYRGKYIYMHKQLLPCDPAFEIDHKDRNGLNNQMDNLRIATSSQNSINFPRINKTGYRGVAKNHNRWMAMIKTNHLNIYLGTFDSAQEAAKAYDEAARNLHGEFAWLNFPALDAAQTEGDIEVLKRVSGMLDIERARLKVQVR